jgi:hypothetical protein
MFQSGKILLICVFAIALAACDPTVEQTTQISPDTSSTTNPPPSTFANQTFAQEIEVLEPVTSAQAGAIITLPVNVRNTSNFVWQNQGSNPVNLSYHWLDASGDNIIVFEGERTPLPENIPPQQEAQINATIRIPETPGNYTLSLNMVQEGVIWFDNAGAPATNIPVSVAN